MKKTLVVLLLPLLIRCGGTTHEPNTIETVTEKILRLNDNESDALAESLVVSADRMNEAIVANFNYKKGLTFDVYYPPDFPAEHPTGTAPIPFVVFPTSFSSDLIESWERNSWKDQDHCISWGRLLATRGTAAVFYDTTSVTEDLKDLMVLLFENGSKLGLDANMIGVIAYSGNGRIGMQLVLDPRPDYATGIRAAAFLHANIRTAAMSRKDVPIFIVYTDKSGTDFEFLSKTFVNRAQRAGLEITIRNDAKFKNFQYDDPTAESREIVIQLFEFMERHIRE